MLTKLIGNPWVLAGIALAFVGLASLAGWYAWEADNQAARADAAVVEQERLRGQLQEAVRVNKENLAALDEIKAAQRRAEEIAAKLADELQVSTDSQLALANKLALLKSADANVKSFLDTPFPDAVLRLYGYRAEAGDRSADQAGQAGRAGEP